MTISNFPALSIVVPSIFVINLGNGVQFLDASCTWGDAVTVKSQLNKM